MAYAWKKRVAGYAAKVAADEAAAELIRIKTDRGQLRPADVVDESRPDEAPLHPVFEWDDHVAAEAHRCEQARHLIRSVVITGDDGQPGDVRAFVSIDCDGPPEYVQVEEARDDEEMRGQVLDKALTALRAWSRTYGSLKEFMALTTIIEQTIELFEQRGA